MISRGGTIKPDDNPSLKYQFYFGRELGCVITMKDGTTLNGSVLINTESQKILFSDDKVRPREIDSDDIVSIKMGSTIVYRIDGLYNQVLKSAGETSLCVIKVLNVIRSGFTEAYAKHTGESVASIVRDLL